MKDIEIVVSQNERALATWGKFTYWLFELDEQGKRINYTYINSNVELKGSEIEKAYREVEKYYDKALTADALFICIANFFLAKRQPIIIEDSNQLNEIIEYVKEI